MKTKHILTAIALPSLLVACNNEEFENIEFTQPQSERPLLSENFVLKVTSEGEGAESRYAVEGDQSLTSKFETGDLLGAAIIDEYKNNVDPEEWKIIGSIAGNIPFKYNAETSIWSASSRLGIGHYLYTFPYNPEDNNRGAASYSLPTVQELYNDVDGVVDLNAAVEKGNKAVYSDLVTEDDLSLNASLKNLYSYPKFVVSFDNGQPVTTVSQVVLEYTGNSGNGFEVKGRFNHEEVFYLFHPEYRPGGDGKATDWDAIQTADFLRTREDYGSIDHSKYIIAKLPNNAKVQTNSLTNNKTIEVRFMMPGALTEDKDKAYGDKLNMYVYTNNGVYIYEDVYDNIVFKQTTTSEQKKRVFARNASYTITLNNLTKKAESTPYIVTDVQSWNKLVSDYGASVNPVTVAVVGDNFTLNADAKMPSKATFTITTPVKIEGNVTIKNVTVDNTVTVEKGATLTTSSTFAADKVENNGTLNIAVALDKDSEIVDYTIVEAIENNGTLNIIEEAVATFALTNKKGAVVENKGTVILKNNTSSNAGTINNAGAIEVYDLINGDNELDTDGNVTYSPVINNNGEILSKGSFVNNSTIINNGEITCDATFLGQIDNNYVIDSKKDKITYITSNTGTVVVYEANPGADIKITTNSGVVEYTTSNTTENFENSIVTKVIASKDLSLTKKGSVNSIVMEKTGSLTLPEGANNLVELEVKSGVTTVAKNISVNKLIVNKKSTVIIPAKVTMTATRMSNEGSILVSGTLKTDMIQGSTEAGTIKVEGPEANVIWNTSSIEEKQKAIVEVVKEYINETNAYVNDEYNVVYDEDGFLKYWNSTNVKFDIKLDFIDKYGKEILSEQEVKVAVSTIDNDATNKTKVIKALETATLSIDKVLYDSKDGATTDGKTSAYATFRNSIVNTTIGLSGLDNTTLRSAKSLTEAEIDKVIESKKPTMYIWKGCILNKAMQVWKDYNSINNSAVNGINDCKYTVDQTSAANMVKWMNLILNASSEGKPAVEQAQKALSEIGINITNTKSLRGYTSSQMSAIVGILE